MNLLGQNICMSGGAEGADLQWGMMAGRRGHTVFHWSFTGHNSLAPAPEVVILTPEQLSLADPALERANATLRRVFPTRSIPVNNLLRRNWYQVSQSAAVYGVSHFKKDQEVDGGTAWAAQMYMDRFAFDGLPISDARLYLFDQKEEVWWQWTGVWNPIESPPEPEGIWAGIGSRKLLPAGKEAIRTLLGGYP